MAVWTDFVNAETGEIEYPKAEMRMTCDTVGCPNQGRFWTDTLTFTLDDAVLAFCGLCDQPITDLSFVV